MKKSIIILTVLTMVFGMAACGAGNGGGTEEPVPQLTIGVMGSVDAVPLAIAQEKGIFKSNGVKVKVEIFKAAKDRDAALEAGLLDGVICDEIAIAIYQNAGLDMRISGITDGMFTLVAGKDTGINSVADFAGKKVAISENTVIEYTLDKLAKEAGISGQIEKVIVPPMPARMEMLSSGQVDGALLPNPFSDAAILSGSKEIATIDSTGQYISVIAFSAKALKDKAVPIEQFFKAYDESADYINTTPVSEYEDIIISFVGYPEAMKGNIVLPFFRSNALPPKSDVEEVFQWAKDKGLITEEINVDSVFR